MTTTTANKVKPAHDYRLNNLKLIQSELSTIMKKMHIDKSFHMPSEDSDEVCINISTYNNAA